MNRTLQPAIRNSVLLFVGSLLFHLAGTWSLPLIDRDEPRFAEASREMRERGDYVIPYFNNEYRFDKPPLTYWAQVASYSIFGENEFGARFPSAVAAALTALVLLRWGRGVGGEAVGLSAALIFTLSLQVFLLAKAATADMWMILFVTMAHAAGWTLLTKNRAAAIVTLFGLALGLGFLAKGPIAWIPLGTVIIAALRSERTLLTQWRFYAAWFLALVLVAIWGIPAMLRTDGEFFKVGIGKHVVERSVATMEGHGARSFGMYVLTLPFYFVTVFASFFPWSIKLPALLRRLRKNADSLDAYLLIGAGLIFLIFSLVKTKLPHYTLPAFPLLALLLARHWAVLHLPFFRKVARWTAAALLALALLLPPLIQPYFVSRTLAQVAKGDLQPAMEFAAVNYHEPSLVWYFRHEVDGWFTPLGIRRAREFMERPGARFIIMPSHMVAKVFPDRPVHWKMHSAEGFNVAKGIHVELALISKSE